MIVVNVNIRQMEKSSSSEDEYFKFSLLIVVVQNNVTLNETCFSRNRVKPNTI